MNFSSGFNNSIFLYSIIIRCYNEEKHIGKLLIGILNQTCKPQEIIIVDSGSTDATLAIAAHFNVRIVKIKKEEFSFGRALNIGCSHANFPILLFASAHVYPVYQNWAEALLKKFSDDKVGLVYGKQRAGGTSKYSEEQIMKRWFPEISDYDQKHPFCNNANIAIRKKIWEETKYSEDLTGLEDLHWAKKIKEKEYKIVYEADAEVVHIHNESYRRIYNRYYREALAMKRIYPEEKFGMKDFFKLCLLNIFSDILSAWKEKRVLKNIFCVIFFRYMQFLGTYRGFHCFQGTDFSILRERFYYPGMQKNQIIYASTKNDFKIHY